MKSKKGSMARGSALLKTMSSYARLEATRADHLSDVKKWLPSVLGVFRRAYAGKSMKAALQAFCIECQGFDDARAGIRDCAAYACPLWEYRPYQGVRLGNPGLTAGAAGTCMGEPRCSPLLQPSPETGCSAVWACPWCGCDETWFDRTISYLPDGTEDGMKTRCVKCGRANDDLPNATLHLPTEAQRKEVR